MYIFMHQISTLCISVNANYPYKDHQSYDVYACVTSLPSHGSKL